MHDREIVMSERFLKAREAEQQHGESIDVTVSTDLVQARCGQHRQKDEYKLSTAVEREWRSL